MAGSSNALIDVSARTEDLKYLQALTVNVSNFVSVKLSGRDTYKVWNAQMLCLIKSQVLLHSIDPDNYDFPEDKGVHMIGQYKELVKGWMFGSMNEKVLNDFINLGTAREIWTKLESLFNSPISVVDDGSLEAVDAIAPIVSPTSEDLRYLQASSVNISNFVSVKLSGGNNYDIWEVQLFRLLRSQDLFDILFERDTDRRYDNLVRGWIFSSVNEAILKRLVKNRSSLSTAKDVWDHLTAIYNRPLLDYTYDPAMFVVGIESVSDIPEMENTDIDIGTKKELYEATVEGCWWKAKAILKKYENAATKPITEYGDTVIHLAVQRGHDYFLKNLLEFLKEGKDVETRNNNGRTALHVAALVGNVYAAQLLIQKSKTLPGILDNRRQSPLECSFANPKGNVSAYLLNFASPQVLVAYSSSSHLATIVASISAKQYDSALRLLTKFPDTDSYDGLVMKFKEIAETNDLVYVLRAITAHFPTNLGFTESFIYPSFHNVRQKSLQRASLLFNYSNLEKCVDDILRVMNIFNNTFCSWLGKRSIILLVPIAILHPIYQLICLLILVLRLAFSMLYFILWKFLAITVYPIKNIEKKKQDHEEAKEILGIICRKMGSTNHNHYSQSILEAVRQDTYEVVDEILFRSPYSITCKGEEGHNIIQLAVINRSIKVYNLLRHITKRSNSNTTMEDTLMNNLAHLVGRLAPSSVLSRTTGAALQLQRELLWRADVENLISPSGLKKENADNETPAMVFTREHQGLIEQGEQWMKTTAESCSITAALIITVVFAAAITVPGGSNQDSGIPVFKNETAFTVFAISNALSLFTATTSLLLFLSILTTRFSEIDFLVSLPRRLIFGLSMLFLSTTAMIVAFGAILFLVFCDQRPWMLAPIAGFACLPISVIVTIKLPLLVDLIQSTYSSIFGMKGYLESCKVNPKHTVFRF